MRLNHAVARKLFLGPVGGSGHGSPENFEKWNLSDQLKMHFMLLWLKLDLPIFNARYQE